MRRTCAGVLLALAASPLAAAPVQEPVVRAVEQGFPAVVNVIVEFGDDARIMRPGSGVLVDPAGLVVTNAHLVKEVEGEGASDFRLAVRLANGGSFPASVVARDERLDLALLVVELPPGARIPFARFADLRTARTGAPVIAAGLPGQEEVFATTLDFAGGPVHLRGTELAADEHLAVDLVLAPDTDGSALFDANGALLGIVNASHVLKFEREPEPEDLAKPSWIVIVRSDAVRRAFAEQLVREPVPSDAPSVVADAAEAVADAVVGVWAGDPEDLPAPDPQDPIYRKAVPGLQSGVVVDPSGLVITDFAAFEERREVEAEDGDQDGDEGKEKEEGGGEESDNEGAEQPRADEDGAEKKVLVLLCTGERLPGRVIAERRFRGAGVALVQVDVPEGRSLAWAELGDSEAVIPGEIMTAVGNPGGRGLLACSGVLSAVERRGRLQVAARIHAAHAGGPVVDVTGRVVGIGHADLPVEGEGRERERESGLSLATPANSIREWFRPKLEELGCAEHLLAPRAATEDELARRRSPITELVERTQGSLLNVFVRVEIEEEPRGFDPFDDGSERVFRNEGLGSGVIIHESGLALTNWHVVESATERGGKQRDDHELEVSVHGGKIYPARVLSSSRVDDLALIALELGEGERVKPVPLARSNSTRVGQTVVAIGHPFGLADTVSCGIVSGLLRNVRLPRRARVFRGLTQTDAAINPGNSGGALLNLDGELVGVNSAGSRFISGMGAAIPVERVRDVFQEKLLSAEGLRSVYWGADVRDAEGTVLVTSVDPHGPASRAGLRSGDRVVRVAGEAVEASVAFVRRMMQAHAGVALELQLERRGEAQTVELVPVSHAAWTFFRLTGLEVEPLDYRAENDLLRDASVALYRTYTGHADGEPRELMEGALRVVRVHPAARVEGLDVRAGDLLLGMTNVFRRLGGEVLELERFEEPEAAIRAFERLHERGEKDAECWVWRDDEVLTARVKLRAKP